MTDSTLLSTKFDFGKNVFNFETVKEKDIQKRLTYLKISDRLRSFGRLIRFGLKVKG